MVTIPTHLERAVCILCGSSSLPVTVFPHLPVALRLLFLDIAVAVQPWLNELLQDDVLDNGYVCELHVASL